MSEQAKSSFEKARDKALRALISQGDLTPEQVSSLKLRQLHLATSTLVVEPDEFAVSPETEQKAINLKLDASMQRALIDWLVVRPDGPNDHLFPGVGQEGLDVAMIKQVAAEKKPVEPAEAAKAQDKTDMQPDKLSDLGAPVDLPEPLPDRPRRRQPGRPTTPSPPPARQPRQPEAVPLEEIEALRKRLADAYDAWSPAVTPSKAAPAPKPESRPATPAETRSPTAPPPEKRPGPGVARPEEGSRGSPRPSAPREEEARREVPRPPAPRREQAWQEVPRPSAPRREEPRRETPRSPAPKTEAAGKEAEEAAPAPVSSTDVKDKVTSLWKSGGRGVTLSYRAMAAAGVSFFAVICCVGLAVAGAALLGNGGPAGLVAVATPSDTGAVTESASAAPPSPSPSATPTATSIPSPTLAPSPTAMPTPVPINTSALTPTPIIIVVTATPTPEPPPTNTPVPTNTPEGGAPAEPTAPPAPAFKYPAPTLLQPKNGGVVPGSINYLKWEPVGPLADDEWYAVRLVFLQQGQPVYEGDHIKDSEWLVPERFYYQADGPALEYKWYVFVERQNPDGSTSQISPESETYVFRWE